MESQCSHNLKSSPKFWIFVGSILDRGREALDQHLKFPNQGREAIDQHSNNSRLK